MNLQLRPRRRPRSFRCVQCRDALALRRAVANLVREAERHIDRDGIPPALYQGREVLARTRNLES